jgi:CrcB protein
MWRMKLAGLLSGSTMIGSSLMQSGNSTGRRKIVTMNWTSLLAIGGGAVLGAWLRYGLGLWLNPVFVTVPLGTLAANLVGGYLVGAAVMVFHLNAEMPPEAKLFFITGFLGALTTFSTFSAEVVHLIQNARYGWAAGAAAMHLFGSLLMTGLGIFTVHKLAQ